jgi:low temperature requirement protein LtrA
MRMSPGSICLSSRAAISGDTSDYAMTMAARFPHEKHRVSTPLELFFDLVFVVAIARAAAGFHHSLSEMHAGAGLVGYIMAFFAIWWAWMNFTWFASAYDSDDVWYRIAVLVQITGALILAAGIPDLFETRQINVATVGGYVVMRLAMVGQWLRAARSDPDHRTTALRYAIGISILQVIWAALLLVREWTAVGFVIFAFAELMVPVWAERARQTTWHPHHIAERYGLFTIIVLGESILSATVAIQAVIASGEPLSPLVPTIIGGLLIVYSMWWIYFDRPAHDLLTSFRRAMAWGYGHYAVFAAAAAVGAGLAVVVDQLTHRSEISPAAAGFTVTIPVVIFLLCLWALHYRPTYRRTKWLGPMFAPFILLSSFTGQAVLSTGLMLAGIVAIKVVVRRRFGEN